MKNSELSLTSQMLVAALQISAPVFSQRPKQLLPFFLFIFFFLKSQRGLLGEDSKVHVKVF